MNASKMEVGLNPIGSRVCYPCPTLRQRAASVRRPKAASLARCGRKTQCACEV